jgi:hypothetical protein
MLTFKDLERPMIDVLHEHNMVTPELSKVLNAAKVTTARSLCQLEVCGIRADHCGAHRATRMTGCR